MPRRAPSPLRSPAVALSAIIAGVAYVTALARGRRRTGPAGADGLVAGLAAVAAFTALQLVPLPPPVLRLLSPNAAAPFERHRGPIGAWPTWRPLSLDPGATAPSSRRTSAGRCLAPDQSIRTGDGDPH